MQNQLNTLAGREREHFELVEYVEAEKTLQERRQNANILQRAKWFVFGRSEEQ